MWSMQHAFTLVELLVVTVTIGILVVLLLPTLVRSKETGRRTACRNNQQQLVLAVLMYAQDDSRGRVSPSDPKFWGVTDENWLQSYGRLPVSVFFCPSTKNGSHVALSHYRDGLPFYFDLTNPALHANSTGGYSYDIMAWFADMENFWNGNVNSSKNSRFILKMLSNLNSYSHQSEAFGLQGRRPGIPNVWVFTDNDIHGLDPFYPDTDSNHGEEGANTAFADGHVEWIKRQDYVFRYELSQDNNRTKAHPRPHP